MEQQSGLEKYYIVKNNKKLKYGYTTGSCAAGAAKAAVRMLLKGEYVSQVDLMTPKGILLHLAVLDVIRQEEEITCGIRKDAGDDPDVTNGILIQASAKKCEASGVIIEAGEGVGRITRNGLEQAIGSPAINKIPRLMITQCVEEEAKRAGYEGGIQITISVPGGEEIAKRTFNPRLGIVGGISILGTSGIVEPMSEAALIKSIEVEMRMKVDNGYHYLLITPGNYGETYLKENMQMDFRQNMKCSNFVGETIDMAVNMGVKGILFISHIGKFIKVAAGIMNTHSHAADARAEVMAANAVRAGASLAAAKEILETNTTEEALGILRREGILETAMQEVTEKIAYYLEFRACHALKIGAIIFSNEYGYLGQTEQVKDLIQSINAQAKIERV